MLMLLCEMVLLQAIALALIMAVAWQAQQRTGNSGWIDVSWTLAIGSVGTVSALVPIFGSAALPTRQLAVASLVAIWSLRLAAHIGKRAIRNGDDPRYAELIRKWGSSAPRRMFGFAQAQALAGVPLVLAVTLAAQRSGTSFEPQDWVGIAIWATGIVLAALADRQMRLFVSIPGNRGKVFQHGLWAFSRHPNYFFEWLGWVGVALIAIDVDGGYAWSWLALAAPAWMYWLLVHVSGIPPLEEHLLRTRGEIFLDYQKRVSAFFPWPPAPRSSQ